MAIALRTASFQGMDIEIRRDAYSPLEHAPTQKTETHTRRQEGGFLSLLQGRRLVGCRKLERLQHKNQFVCTRGRSILAWTGIRSPILFVARSPDMRMSPIKPPKSSILSRPIWIPISFPQLKFPLQYLHRPWSKLRVRLNAEPSRPLIDQQPFCGIS